MSTSLRTLFPADMTWRHYAVLLMMFLYLFSIPPKWSGVPVVGILLVALFLTVKREEWCKPSLRMHVFYTSLWLVPVALATVGQHLAQVETATPWSELAKMILRMFVVGLGILLLLERRWISLPQLTLLIILSLSVHAFAGVIEWLMQADSGLAGWRKVRVRGMTSNPNSLAPFVALAVILCVGHLRVGMNNALLWAAAVVAFACVLATGSRGGLLMLAAGLFVLFPPVTKPMIVRYAIGLSIIGIGLVLAVDQGLVKTSFATSNSSRVHAISFGIEMIGKAPLVGWGMESFTSLPGHSGLVAPHNIMIDLALSGGVIALAGWLAVVVLIGYRLAISPSHAARLLLALFLASFVYANIEASLMASNEFRNIWILLMASSCYVLGLDALKSRQHWMDSMLGKVKA